MDKIMCLHCSHKIDKCPNCGEPFDQIVNQHIAKEERKRIVALDFDEIIAQAILDFKDDHFREYLKKRGGNAFRLTLADSISMKLKYHIEQKKGTFNYHLDSSDGCEVCVE